MVVIDTLVEAVKANSLKPTINLKKKIVIEVQPCNTVCKLVHF